MNLQRPGQWCWEAGKLYQAEDWDHLRGSLNNIKYSSSGSPTHSSSGMFLSRPEAGPKSVLSQISCSTLPVWYVLLCLFSRSDVIQLLPWSIMCKSACQIMRTDTKACFYVFMHSVNFYYTTTDLNNKHAYSRYSVQCTCITNPSLKLPTWGQRMDFLSEIPSNYPIKPYTKSKTQPSTLFSLSIQIKAYQIWAWIRRNGTCKYMNITYLISYFRVEKKIG